MLEINHSKKDALVEFLVHHVVDGHPAVVLEGMSQLYRDAPSDKRDRAFSRLNRMLGKWSDSDPFKALDWFRNAKAGGLFESKKIARPDWNESFHNETRAAAKVFRGLIGQDKRAALEFYESLGPSYHQGLIAGSSKKEHLDFLVGLADKLPDNQAKLDAFSGILDSLVSEEKLSDSVAAFIAGLELDANLKNDLLRTAASHYIVDKNFEDEHLDRSLEWIGTHAHRNWRTRYAAKCWEKWRASSSRREVADSRFDQMRAAGASDRFAAGYLESSNLGDRRTDRAFAIISSMSDPAARHDALMSLWVFGLTETPIN